MYYAIVDVSSGRVKHTSEALRSRRGGHPKEAMLLAWIPGTVWGSGNTQDAAIQSATDVRNHIVKQFENLGLTYQSPLCVFS